MNQQYAKKGYLLEDFRLFHLKDMGEAKVDYHYHEFYKLLFFLSANFMAVFSLGILNLRIATDI